MKKILLPFIILLSGLTGPLPAQDTAIDLTALQANAEQYLNARLERDWSRLMEFIYPAVFQHITAEELIAELENGEEGRGLAPAPHELGIAGINTPQVIGEERFALIETTTLSELHLDGPQFQDERLVSLLQRNFERQYGSENVEYLPEESLLRVRTSGHLLAIAGREDEHWRFLERSPEFQELWIKCLPAEAGSLTTGTHAN